MAFKEFEKNLRNRIRVRSRSYNGHDLVDVRMFAPRKGETEFLPTRTGVSINIDLIPDLIESLEWALLQPCTEDDDAEPRRVPSQETLQVLSTAAHEAMRAHGSAMHWDSAERIILSDKSLSEFTKWDLHYVLATRKDLFKSSGGGVFRAK